MRHSWRQQKFVGGCMQVEKIEFVGGSKEDEGEMIDVGVGCDGLGLF